MTKVPIPLNAPRPSNSPHPADSLTEAVRDQYGAVAASDLSTRHPGVREVAEAFGYSAGELASIPAEANMGLSCGNPTAFASLRPGEVVVDLGCGGGLDVLLAAPKVGPAGRAIGIDMTPAMIERARANAARAGLANAEFHLATIDRLPLPDASADCVISNCVINLAPDKPAVFREIARVLKPGGRLAVSDIALKRPLPEELARDVMAYVGCIAGAVAIDDYRRQLSEAGFAAVEVIDSGADLNAYAKVENQSACCSPAMALPLEIPAPPEAQAAAEPPAEPAAGAAKSPGQAAGRSTSLAVASTCCAPTPVSAPAGAPAGGQGVHGGLADLLRRYNLNDYAASVKVYAVKPR